MFRSVAGTGPTLAARSTCAARSGTGLTGHGAEIFVDAPQQVDQNFLFLFVQAGQQPAFAIEGGDDDLVMRRTSLRGQRDRVAAAIVRGGPDRDEAAFLQQRERTAHRTLVEAHHVTDARPRNPGLTPHHLHDPPPLAITSEFSPLT